MKKLRILFLAANPIDTDRLKLDEEYREIQAKLRGTTHQEHIEFFPWLALRADDLVQLFNEQNVQIVHFCGHGNRSGGLIFVGQNGLAKPASPKALRALFHHFSNDVKVVVLNACYSELQAIAISEAIDCVIGMTDQISDDAATLFAASFYRALGFGRSVKDAFEQSVISLGLEESTETEIPQLIVRNGCDPSMLYPIKLAQMQMIRDSSLESKETIASSNQNQSIHDERFRGEELSNLISSKNGLIREHQLIKINIMQSRDEKNLHRLQHQATDIEKRIRELDDKIKKIKSN